MVGANAGLWAWFRALKQCVELEVLPEAGGVRDQDPDDLEGMMVIRTEIAKAVQ
jgi:hypothetical protein